MLVICVTTSFSNVSSDRSGLVRSFETESSDWTGMNQETLHTMLRMAEGDARGCFLKHEHSEYGTDEPGDMKSLAVMPNVCLFLL